jgi:hypothetical protein
MASRLEKAGSHLGEKKVILKLFTWLSTKMMKSYPHECYPLTAFQGCG